MPSPPTLPSVPPPSPIPAPPAPPQLQVLPRLPDRISPSKSSAMSDRLSELPDYVLLHIMNLMNAKDAVQTCLLSKRWKHLWKSLTNLTFHSLDFRRLPIFSKFVSSVLSCRDDSISLHNLDLWRHGRIETNLLNSVMTYAASHHVQQLIIRVSLSMEKDFQLPSSIFYCRSLTFLKLCFGLPDNATLKIKLPKSLELPALKSLHIKNVTFATGDNGCVQPFSTCHMLNTLVIEHCYLQSDAEVLCISNSKLFSLTIISYRGLGKAYQVTLSTPNLNLLTIKGHLVHQLSSTSNITCLEELNIDVICYNGLVLISWLQVVISWLQVLANVKIMTLSWGTFEILNALLSCGSTRTQFPCFVRLKTLKLEKKSFANISDEEVSRVVQYLLQNSPLTSVDIIKFCTLEGFKKSLLHTKR